jgi:hypothetical protein
MTDNKLTDNEIKRMIARCCENCIHENKTAYEEPCKFCYSHSEFATKDFVHKIKAEAYKEVFEKLNEKANVQYVKKLGGLYTVKVVTLHDINTLKKELVGE